MPLLVCPNCQTGMNEVSRNNVLIDVCPKCRGVWLDGGEMEKLLGQVRSAEVEYMREVDHYREHPNQPYQPRSAYDTDDDSYYKQRRKKSTLGRIFDIFD